MNIKKTYHISIYNKSYFEVFIQFYKQKCYLNTKVTNFIPMLLLSSCLRDMIRKKRKSIFFVSSISVPPITRGHQLPNSSIFPNLADISIEWENLFTIWSLTCLSLVKSSFLTFYLLSKLTKYFEVSNCVKKNYF